MPRAPASASSPGLPRPRPSGRHRLLHRPRDQRHPSPPPAPPGPGPARRAPGYLGQAGARPGLWEPEECMAGGRRRRRGPPGSRSRAAWRLAPQGPAVACAPAGGEGWREEAAAPLSAL